MAPPSKATLEMAYIQATGLNKTVVKKKEHQDRMANALENVWMYEGLFDGETEDGRNRRFDVKSAGEGKPTDLASYFRNIYPGEYEEMSAWAVIFTMQVKLDGMKGEGENTEDSVPALSDTTNINKSKENETMANETNTAALEALNAANNSLSSNKGNGPVIPGAADDMPSAYDRVTALNEVAKLFNAKKEERTNYTKNAKVEKLVVANQGQDTIFVGGIDNATGTIKDPAATLRSYDEKTGFSDANGTVVFTQVAPADYAQALAVREAIKEATIDGSKTFKVYKSTAMPAIKGVKLNEGKGKEGFMTTLAELTNIAMSKAAGIIKTVAGSDIQFQMDTITRTVTQTAAVGSGAEKTKQEKNKNKSAYAGVATLRLTHRKEALENKALIDFHRVINKEVPTELSACKSDLSVKYLRKPNKAGKVTTGTYRIPLVSEKYVLVLNGDQMKVFGDGVGVGRTFEAVNTDDAAAMDKMLNSLANIATDAMLRAGNDDTFAELREAAEAAEQRNADVQAAKMGGATL